MKFYLQIFSFLILISIQSCKKDSVIKDNTEDPAITKPDVESQFGTVTITFNNKARNEDLVLNSKSYTNANGDSFTVSKFKYYISNIILKKSDGTTFKERESYHLVDLSQGLKYALRLDSVPIGTYTGMSFILGVDSARNTSGAQTGALDPSLGMFWSWNQGYIFLMMEGNSPHSNAFNNTLIFHLGGFTPPYSCIRTINPTFGNNELISASNKTSKIDIKTDIVEMFGGKTLIKFAQTSEGMGGAVANTVANNCVSMFTVSSIEN